MADPVRTIAEAEQALLAGKLDQAAELAERVLLANPHAGIALNILGLVAARRGNSDVALTLWETAARAAPALPQPWISMGEAFFHLGQVDKTELCFREALNRNPDLHDVRANLGLALQRLGRHEEAVNELRRALVARPDHSEASLALATSLHELRRTHQAIDVLLEANRRHPRNPKILGNLGVLHEKSDRLEEAVEWYSKAVEINSNEPEPLFNRGSSLIQLLRIDEARRDWQAAMRIDPGNANYRNNLAILELLDGNLEKGFELFESRFELRHKKFPIPYPEWNGSPLEGRHLLLYAEQGLGDAIQFCRFIPILKQLHPRSRISLITLPTLHELLRSLQGLDGIYDVHPPYAKADLALSLLSVPRVLQTTMQTIPAHVPYLSANPAKVNFWRARLAAKCGAHRPNIGLFWRGTQVDPNRAVRLDDLAPILRAAPNANFISLQKGEGEEELAGYPKQITSVGQDLLDYGDTAALLVSLDLLITIDTSIAHAAGALALPAWVMVPFRPDWRWLIARSDTPWYPTIKLYRQAARREWTATIELLARDLDLWNRGWNE